MAFPLQTRYCSGHSRGNAEGKIRSEGGIPVPWQGVDLAPFGGLLLPHPGITLNGVSVAEQPGLGDWDWLTEANLLPMSSWVLFISPTHCPLNAPMTTLEPVRTVSILEISGTL